MRTRRVPSFLAFVLSGALRVAVLAAGIAGPAAALTYIDISPTGSQFPQWDGGMTELEFADINGDGQPDLLSIGDHGSPYVNTDEHGVMVYFGTGGNGWSIHQEGDFGYGGIAIGDVNNDGLLDVGYGMHHNYSGQDFGDQLIEAALGDGTGLHWTPWDDGLATNGEDYGMAATEFADIDNDGLLDIVCHSFGCCNGIHVYRNNGDGTWTQTWALTGGNARTIVCCGDVNGDGFPDIAASYQNGTVFLNDGTGRFTRADAGLPPPGDSGLNGVTLGDVDGDGCADLAFTVSSNLNVYLWRGDHWEAANTGLPTGGYARAQLCDMNSDGNLDVIAMGSGTCTVFLGDSAGHWTQSGGFYKGPANTTEAFRAGADVDHNGFPDVIFLQDEGSWPNDRNHLYVYKESSVPASRFVSVQYPHGNELLYAGSVQTIRWCAAHVGGDPATVSIDLSTSGPEGPWEPVADHIPDSGHRQWIVNGAPSEVALLRITLHQGGEDVFAVSRPFRLRPLGSSGVYSSQAGGGPSGSIRLAAFPNPMREQTRILLSGAPVQAAEAGPGNASQWSSSDPLSLRILLYDLSGRRLTELEPSGAAAVWNRTDRWGRRVPAGIYLATVKGLAGSRSAVRIVILP